MWLPVALALGNLFLACLCEEIFLNGSRTCEEFEVDLYRPYSPRVLCCLLPEDFYWCESVEDANTTSPCRFGGQTYEDVQTTLVNCSVLEGVECAGERSFTKTDVPCVKSETGCSIATIL
ncbi:TM2 domain-containing protein 2 [Geodia barretti]|uniref:TM2 domain-containing protein 2 n=1 Tax=Geodia barretti TaxID=519541 RepID=A0AA35TLN0_GEOBA|nr:TM2 domain-containing protein 2 [Geodia barretti]